MSTERRRCWAEIDLGALRHNLRFAQEKIGARAGVMAVVKANAYGHGMPQVATAIRDEVRMFGVANVAEASTLRDALQSDFPDIFILGPALAAEREEIVRQRFIPAVSTVEEASAFATFRHGERVRLHLVIDTGMGRIGVWQDEAIPMARAIAQLADVELAGIATHLPVSDEDENFTTNQLAHFEEIVAELRAAGIEAPDVHSLNSAGVLQFSSHAQELVRAGLMLYGSSPVSAFQNKLQAVMTLKTRVTLVRDFAAGRGVSYGRTYITPHSMRIATLAVGYADGYPRRLSNTGAEVLLRGRRCAVLGRVTMDQIMIDVTHLPETNPGDEVVLMGRQGDDEIFAADLAKKAETIAWEIFTGISGRVERVYV
ncbi:MAG: alanine racemase [Chthoniobacter sp.]|nr:alanine racemase [Chthoniobacter sp.]